MNMMSMTMKKKEKEKRKMMRKRKKRTKKLQQQLIQLHYLSPGEDDGKFGKKTRYAVMEFQKKEHIAVDGVAGTQTFVKLNEILGTLWDVPVG